MTSVRHSNRAYEANPAGAGYVHDPLRSTTMLRPMNLTPRPG